jgi:hypothetical protein
VYRTSRRAQRAGPPTSVVSFMCAAFRSFRSLPGWCTETRIYASSDRRLGSRFSPAFFVPPWSTWRGYAVCAPNHTQAHRAHDRAVHPTARPPLPMSARRVLVSLLAARRAKVPTEPQITKPSRQRRSAQYTTPPPSTSHAGLTILGLPVTPPTAGL